VYKKGRGEEGDELMLLVKTCRRNVQCLKDLGKLCPLNKIILAVASLLSSRALLYYQSEYSFLEHLGDNRGVARFWRLVA
jgi:hypothetical protein